LAKRFLILLCLMLMAPVFAAEVAEDPLERQTLAIAKDLRCAVCQSQPVSESNSDLARDMRAIIREQLEAGKSREEIVEYFVSRYGNYVLMKPPYDETGTLLWLAPVLLLAAMAIGGWLFLRNRKNVELPPVAALSEEDRARIKSAEQAARNEDEAEK
jgi:cytochrome c-type biogenesis protein CcmH